MVAAELANPPLADRYRARFGSFPPIAIARAISDDLLASLMEKALETGQEVTMDVLAEATGGPMPPGALT